MKKQRPVPCDTRCTSGSVSTTQSLQLPSLHVAIYSATKQKQPPVLGTLEVHQIQSTIFTDVLEPSPLPPGLAGTVGYKCWGTSGRSTFYLQHDSNGTWGCLQSTTDVNVSAPAGCQVVENRACLLLDPHAHCMCSVGASRKAELD